MEDALDTLLSEVAHTGEAYVPQTVLQRFNNLCSNRAAKYRHRHQILYENQRSLRNLMPQYSDLSHIAIQREQLEYLHMLSTSEEKRLLEGLVSGYTYQELADRLCITLSSLKTKIFRLRKRIAQCQEEAM